MRSLLLAALAAAVLTASASAGHSNGTGPKNDLAAGAGKFATTPSSGVFSAMHFSFSAHRTASGIHGNVNYHGVDAGTGEELNGKGPIVCFDVQDNQALIIFEFKDVRPFGERIQFGQLIVEDNGQPSDPMPDRAIAAAVGLGQGGEPPPPFPENCFTLPSGIATLPLESGNVTVHEGTE